MEPTVRVLGVYPVGATKPCLLVEVCVEGYEGPLDMREFTQEIPGQPPESWHIPWDERVLDAEGTRQEADLFTPRVHCPGSLRLAFFLHHLDVNRPLKTPFGIVALPRLSARPGRLSFIEYEAPV